MKRLSRKQREWMKRYAARCERRRLRRRMAADDRKASRSHIDPRWHRISAPAVLSFTENYDEVASLLKQVVAEIGGRHLNFVVDFSTIRRVGTAAALALAAMFDMWQRVRGLRLRAIDPHSWSPDVRRQLVELGMFELLHTRNAPDVSGNAPVKMLKFRSGQGSDGSLAQELIDSIVRVTGPIHARQFLYDGLTEAMTNVSQHAYPEDDPTLRNLPLHFKRWWMAGSFDHAANQMRVVILDFGVGIPATLPRSTNWEIIKGFLAKLNINDDADMIAAAVEAGRTSTGQPGRGHGLDDIRQFVENSVAGHLRIMSGRGEVIYEKGGSSVVKRTLSEAFPGTLIEWEVFR